MREYDILHINAIIQKRDFLPCWLPCQILSDVFELFPTGQGTNPILPVFRLPL